MINGTIQPSAFEAIRDKIGVILTPELANQNDAATVWAERFIPFNSSELPAVNISFLKGLNTQSNMQQDTFIHSFNIDVYTTSDTIVEDGSVTDRGDKLSSFSLQKTLGLIKSILCYSGYRTLNMTPGLIQRTKVASIDIADNKESGDGMNVSMGRITFDVTAIEKTVLEQGVEFMGFEDEVKIEETDKGYKFILIKN